MRTSGPGSFKRQRGFTLLELLIVILIIGVSMATIAISIHTGDRRAQTEAERLASLMRYAAMQARTGGQALAWQGSSTGYHFLSREDIWRAIPDRDGEKLRPRALPEGMQLLLTPNNGDTPNGSSAAQEKAASVVFPASGLAQPFSLQISDTKRNIYKVSGDAAGNISLTQEGSP